MVYYPKECYKKCSGRSLSGRTLLVEAKLTTGYKRKKKLGLAKCRRHEAWYGVLHDLSSYLGHDCCDCRLFSQKRERKKCCLILDLETSGFKILACFQKIKNKKIKYLLVIYLHRWSWLCHFTSLSHICLIYKTRVIIFTFQSFRGNNIYVITVCVSYSLPSQCHPTLMASWFSGYK